RTNIIPSTTLVRSNWASGRGQQRGAGVRGRVAGIVGFGGVGRQVASHLMHLGYRVITVDRPSARQSAADAGVELCDLMTLAERSDVVVLTATSERSARDRKSTRLNSSHVK